MSKTENTPSVAVQACETVGALGLTTAALSGLTYMIPYMPVANLMFALVAEALVGANSYVKSTKIAMDTCETVFYAGLSMFAVGTAAAKVASVCQNNDSEDTDNLATLQG